MVPDRRTDPKALFTKSFRQGPIISAIDQTKTILQMFQIAERFKVERVAAYCSALAGTATIDCRIVRPGGVLDAVTIAIGTNVVKFQVTTTLLRAVAPLIVSPATLPVLVYKAAQDALVFSTNSTINVGAAAGQFWGAVRLQMDSAGVYSTKVAAADQTYQIEADAIGNAPKADNDKIDCGTISIRSAAGVAFTLNTTALNAAGTTVNYNGRASSATSVLSAEVGFTANETIYGTMNTTLANAIAGTIGALLVIDYTTNHTGVLTNGVYEVTFRPFPAAGEAYVPDFTGK